MLSAARHFRTLPSDEGSSAIIEGGLPPQVSNANMICEESQRRSREGTCHGGCCGNEVQAVLPLKTFLDDLAVQKAQEATPEAEAHS